MSYSKTIKHILKHYSLGELTSEPELLEGGFVNKNYKITTTNGTYFFREFIKYGNVQHIEDVNKFLYDVKFPVAKPEKTINGKTFFLQKERLFAIFQFINGQQISVEKYVNAEHEEEAKLWKCYKERELNSARVLAKLHNSVSNVPKRRRVYMDAHNEEGIKHIEKIIQEQIKTNSKYAEVLKVFYNKLSHYIKLFHKLKLVVPKKEDQCVIHGDFWDGQILFDGAEVAALIDFDALFHGRAAYDIMKGGISSFCRTFNPKIEAHSLNKLKLFLKAYSEIAEKPLLIEPRELLFFIIHGKLNVLNHFISEEKESANFINNLIKINLKLLDWCEQHEAEIEHLFKETDNWIKQHHK